MRAIVLKKSFLPNPTGMIVEITVYASGEKGKELADPKNDVKPTIDIIYCSKVDLNNSPTMYHISSLDIDFTNKIFYLSDDRIERLKTLRAGFLTDTLQMIRKINHAKNFKEVWDLIPT
jgi:hypothetical protein